jgi:hypothetical protein
MAKRKIPEPEQRTAFIIKKDEFKTELDSFIHQFSELHSREVKTEDDLEKSESEFYHLTELVDEFLKGSFNKPFNEHRNDFDSSGKFIGLEDVMRRMDTSHPAYRLKKHKEVIESKISTLKTLHSKIKYIPSDIEQTTSFSTAENFSEEEKKEVNRKIDEVLSELHKLHLGQEIIFNEIDELRNLLTLDKKNWRQNLKGKLLDIGLGQLLDKETVEWIYRTLTGDNLNLLK